MMYNNPTFLFIVTLLNNHSNFITRIYAIMPAAKHELIVIISEGIMKIDKIDLP